MHPRALYRGLTVLSLGFSAAALLLAATALLLAHAFEASAAALCAVVFFVPGLLFLNHWHRIRSRDFALAHAGAVAEAEGVIDAAALGEKLKVPKEDAGKILRTAIREGHAQGEISPDGRFVSRTAPRCPRCGKPAPRSLAGGACPSCGSPLAGGD